jgi:hypothetical protein
MILGNRYRSPSETAYNPLARPKMSLELGVRLGACEIVFLFDTGRMGEVAVQ